MLSAIGRSAVQRLAIRTATTSCRHAVVSSQASRVPFRQPGVTWSALSTAARTYATSTEEGSRTRGRPKGTTSSKSTTKKPKKAKKAVKAKPASRPKSRKKELSPEAKAKIERRELKQKALFTEPAQMPKSKWLQYVYENKDGISGNGEFATYMRNLAQSFRQLSNSENERLQSQVEQNKLNNAAAYKAWVESHPMETISEAVNARRKLKRKYNYPKGNIKLITDERQPKKGVMAFTLFTKARWGSGDFANTTVSEVAPKITAEWKALSEAEKQPYIDLQKADAERYERDRAALGLSSRKH